MTTMLLTPMMLTSSVVGEMIDNDADDALKMHDENDVVVTDESYCSMLVNSNTCVEMNED
jgi:hypothetical protein